MSNNLCVTNETNHPPVTLGEERQGHHRWHCCHSSPCSVMSDRLIRAIFLLLGVGILIPWNAFVSAKPYLTSRLCQSGSSVINFEEWFGLVWNSSSVFSLGLIIFGQTFSDYCKRKSEHSESSNGREVNLNTNHSTHNSHLVDEPRPENISNPSDIHAVLEDEQPNSSLSSRNNRPRSSQKDSFFTVMVPLGLYMVIFSIQALLVTIPEVSPTKFLVILFSGLALCGTCGAIATAGIVSTAGHFPSHIGINPFFSGQALGGTAVAIANFVALAIGEDGAGYLEDHCQSSKNDSRESILASQVSRVSQATKRWLKYDFDGSCSDYHNVDWAVLSYFLAGCFVLLLCLVGYQTVVQHQNAQLCRIYESVNNHQGNQDEINIFDEESFSDEVDDNSPHIGLELNDRLRPRHEIQSIDAGIDENQIENDLSSGNREGHIDPDGSKSMLPVVRGPATCIFLTFTVTLCLFPSWVSELKSSHECENSYRLNNDLYVPFNFVVFNMGDLLGRLIAGHIPVNRIRHLSRKLVVCATLRILFLPLFLLCSSTLDNEISIGIQNDFFSLLVQLLFAVSNGILISTSFIWSPQLVGTDSTLQKRASEIMTFSISFGLLSGSFIAFPFLRFASYVLT